MCFFILPHGIVLVNWCLLMSACKNLRNTRLLITKHGWGCHGTRPPYIGPEVALTIMLIYEFKWHLSSRTIPFQFIFCQDHLHKPIYIYIFLCQYIDTLSYIWVKTYTCTALPVRYSEIPGALHKRERLNKASLHPSQKNTQKNTHLN
jgi:hypothetical protein